MAALQCTTIFDAHNPNHRTVPQIRHLNVSWRTAAKQHAKAFGEAKVLRADGSVVRYWCDEGTIRQRTYRHVIMA